MNRVAASIAVLLHCGLLLVAWSGQPRPSAVQGIPPDRPTLALRLTMPDGTPPRRHRSLTAPTVAEPANFRPPAPLLIAPPELQLLATPMPPAQSAALANPSPERIAARETPVRETGPAPLSPEAGPQALVAAALPPEHLACQARQAERHYPAMLRERGIEGRVVVRVKVNEDGRAAEVQVLNPSGWRLMDEAARQVAAACAYLPARSGDLRLTAWIEYPVRFSLQ